VKFIDRTFNIHPDALEIWRFLLTLETDVTFHFEISPDLIKEEHLDLLRTAPKGRIQFEVGIQSTEDEVLRSISRYIGFKKVLPKLEALLSIKNIHSHLDLIAGLPYDTVRTFRASFNEVYPLLPDMLQMGFLKIIKGTPMERDAEAFGMVYSPFPPYEVLKTRWMTYEELRSLHRTEDALERYYNSTVSAGGGKRLLQIL
jgi:radical SAM superfamily enzyme